MLSVTNPHPKDDLLTFREKTHKYIHKPSGLKIRKSVTLFLKTFFPDTFDGREVIDRKLVDWTYDPTHKYYTLIRYLLFVQKMSFNEVEREILKLWKAESKKARDDGTAMHLALENWMNGVKDMEHDHSYAVKQVSKAFKKSFFPSLKLKPYRSEFRVLLTTKVYVPATRQWVEIPVIAGTIDGIFIDIHGRKVLVDWKRVDPSKKGLLGKEQINRFTTYAIGMLKDYPNTSFMQYTCQLIVYKLILERGGYLAEGESVGPMFLCQVHPSMSEPHFVEAGDGLEEEALHKLEALLSTALDGLVEEVKSLYLNDIQSMMDAETEEEEDEDEDEEE